MKDHRRMRLLPLALSPKNTARFLGVSAEIVYAAGRAGEFPIYKIGVKRFILVEDTLRWVRRTFTVETFPATTRRSGDGRMTDGSEKCTKAGIPLTPLPIDMMCDHGS